MALDFSTSVSNATCVDITVIPTLTGKPNVSIGCYSCRNATSIPDQYMYAGFPGEYLEELIFALEKISQKVMVLFREKQSYRKLL